MEKKEMERFLNCLYTQSCVADVLSEYCTPMLSSVNPIKRLKAKRLLSFKGVLEDDRFYSRILNMFSTICEEIEDNFPDTQYELIGRTKALISLINKAEEIEEATTQNIIDDFFKVYSERPRLTFEKMMKNPEFMDFLYKKMYERDSKTNEKPENPFNRIHDFFAFRITIEGNRVGDCIDELYGIANVLLKFFDEKSEFEILPSQPTVQTGELKINPNDIFIPKKSGIEEQYQLFVKDYVISPKQDGYQGLHIIIQDPFTNRDIEIQLRTAWMDIIAETVANHGYYKQEKYHNRLAEIKKAIDYSRIHMDKFIYFPYKDPATGKSEELIRDKEGIIYAVPMNPNEWRGRKKF